jgi:histidine triad (HIT) family protein
VGQVHLHVLPRFAGDGFRLQVSWINQGQAELDATAVLLRASLAAQPG